MLQNRLTGQNEHKVELDPDLHRQWGRSMSAWTDPDEWRRLLDPLVAAAGG